MKIIDTRFRLVFANRLSRQNLGKSLDELRGTPCHKAFYGFAEKCFFCNSKKVFETGEPHQGYTTLAVRGSNRDFQVSIFPLWDATHQQVDYVVEVVKDITALSKGAPLPQSAGRINSRDKRFQLVFEQMAHWADDGWPVLVQGEKETEKNHSPGRSTKGPGGPRNPSMSSTASTTRTGTVWPGFLMGKRRP